MSDLNLSKTHAVQKLFANAPANNSTKPASDVTYASPVTNKSVDTPSLFSMFDDDDDEAWDEFPLLDI